MANCNQTRWLTIFLALFLSRARALQFGEKHSKDSKIGNQGVSPEWALGAAGASCDETCASTPGSCTPESLRRQNIVNATSGIDEPGLGITGLASTWSVLDDSIYCTDTTSSNWPDVPLYDTIGEVCAWSDRSGGGTCDAFYDGARRLCYCDPGELVTLPTPSPPCDTSTATCTVIEDPHINAFDGAQLSLRSVTGMKATRMSGGEMWLVKSGRVSIQARYMPDETLKEKHEFVRAVAVGGTFLRGNIITVGSLEDQITWNGKPILESQKESSRFQIEQIQKDGNFSVLIEQSDNSLNVATMKMNRGINIKLPFGVTLVVNRLQHHLNVAITMPQQEGGQDGLCGNFNGLVADDSMEFTSKRFDPSVPREESLFLKTASAFA